MSIEGAEQPQPADATARPQKGARVLWRPYQIYVLALLVVANIFNYLDRTIIGILQQPIKESLNLSDSQLGWLSGPAFALLYSAAGLPIARFAERIDRAKVLAGALAVWSGFTALCGLAVGYWQLALCRLGVGAGEGACTPSSHALLSEYFTAKQRGMAMAILQTAIPLAQLVAPIIGGVVAMQYGWRAAFIVVGLPGLAAAVLLWFTLRDPRKAKDAPAQRDPGTFWQAINVLVRNRAYVLLFLASTFMGQAITSTNLYTASFFIRQHHMTLAEAGVVTAAGLGIAGLVGTFIGGFIADRFAGQYGRSFLYVCSFGAGLASLLFFATFSAPTAAMAIVTLLLANVATDLKNGPNYAAVQNMAEPHMRATATAVLMVAVVVLGGGLGPLVVGMISETASVSTFPAEHGGFLASCPGGKAPVGSPEALIGACSDASAFGLRTGLMWACFAYAVASTLFFFSGKSIKRELMA